MSTNGGDLEIESETVQRGGAGFDGVDGLIEAVQRGVEFALGISSEMENEVELGFASLERAGVDAFDRRSRRLSPGNKSGEEEERGDDGIAIKVAQQGAPGFGSETQRRLSLCYMDGGGGEKVGGGGVRAEREGDLECRIG